MLTVTIKEPKKVLLGIVLFIVSLALLPFTFSKAMSSSEKQVVEEEMIDINCGALYAMNSVDLYIIAFKHDYKFNAVDYITGEKYPLYLEGMNRHEMSREVYETCGID